MVRLEDGPRSFMPLRVDKFQFLYGTIGRVNNGGIDATWEGFQFLYGTIGSLNDAKDQCRVSRFQFLYGTIGS
tara:strand:- start:320 stop:538 length:219 start_codon:yes stop_codon:yes gene_type:complete